MAGEHLLIRDAIGSFAPGQGLRAALLLTYSFDGKWIEEGFRSGPLRPPDDRTANPRRKPHRDRSTHGALPPGECEI